jgi:tetratricopeptide (TPR) repeat protein
MLFERIRRTQKPIFVFLAVTFAMGFVLLGVGQGAGSINALDFLTGGSSSNDPTSALKDQVTKNPKDATAWRQLATAYQSQGKNDEAISAYESYLGIKKTDASALASVSGLLETRAYYNQQNAASYDAAAQYYDTSPDDTVLNAVKATNLTNSVGSAAGSQYEALATNYNTQASTDVQVALGYRNTLEKLSPTNALNQLGLGYDAANARQYPQAIKALKAYLKLAPDSTQAPQVKQLLAELQTLAGTSTTPGQ